MKPFVPLAPRAWNGEGSPERDIRERVNSNSEIGSPRLRNRVDILVEKIGVAIGAESLV